MHRFFTRSRFGNGRTSARDRPTKALSPVPSTSFVATSDQSTFLLPHETLPSRLPNGHSLDYTAYSPSRFYVPLSPHTARRPRHTVNHPSTGHLHLHFEPNSTNDKDISSTTVDEKAQSNLSSRPAAHTIQHAIRLKVAALRRYLVLGNELGELPKLKNNVSIEREALARARRARHTALVRLHDAATLTGLPPPATVVAPPLHGPCRRPTPVRAQAAAPGFTRVRPIPPQASQIPGTGIRRMHGPPTRNGLRTRSSLRGRQTASVSQDGDHASRLDPGEPTDPLSQTLPRPLVGRWPFGGGQARRPTGKLRRLGSAGSMLIRRMSRTSVGKGEAASMASAASVGSDGLAPAVAAATGSVCSALDRSTIARLKTAPSTVMAELEGEARRLHEVERDALMRVKASERSLEQRRDYHDKAMAILDQFYGTLPGWQQDPITQAMFVETVDMTDAGLETERDLADARHIRAQALAALSDSGLAVGSLQATTEHLGTFISGLDATIRSIAEFENRDAATSQLQIKIASTGDIRSTLSVLEQNLEKAASSAEMALDCCKSVARVLHLERDVRTLRNTFVANMKSAYSAEQLNAKEFAETLHVAKRVVCDCKMAETYMRELEKMVAGDLDGFEDLVESCEEYVMAERLALVDLHHPSEGVAK